MSIYFVLCIYFLNDFYATVKLWWLQNWLSNLSRVIAFLSEGNASVFSLFCFPWWQMLCFGVTLTGIFTMCGALGLWLFYFTITKISVKHGLAFTVLWHTLNSHVFPVCLLQFFCSCSSPCYFTCWKRSALLSCF